MQLNLFIDWGNTLAKLISLLGDVAVEPVPRKQPSLIREIASEHEGVKFAGGKSRFVFGDDAMRHKQGRTFSTFEQRDKIKRLAVVVAYQVHDAIPKGTAELITVSLVVSNPFTADRSENLTDAIYKEVKILTKGFNVNGKDYTVTFDRIGTMPEGMGLLECDNRYDGVIDVGAGSLLSGYRDPLKGIVAVPSTEGDGGGCKTWLSDVLNDGQFLCEVAAKGFTAAPSDQKLSQLLGQGRWDIKGIDFRPHLKRHIGPVLNRVLNAATTLRSAIALASPDDTVEPTIAFIGGGAALFDELLTDKQRATLAELNVEIFDHLPDSQTVLIMHQVFKLSPERFKSFLPKAQPSEKLDYPSRRGELISTAEVA